MQEGDRRAAIYRFLVWILLASILLAAIGFCLYGSAGRDDAHITYWPAYTLAHMGKIINYNGEVIEQSSSLLQVVLLASSHVASGIDIVTLGRLVSILFGVLTLPLTYILASRFHPKAGPISTLTTSLCGSFVYWSFGGLETTLATFCTLWILVKFSDILDRQPGSYFEWGHVAIATLAFVTVRPEMPIVLGCVILGTGVILFFINFWNHSKKRLLILTVLSVGIVISIFSIRYIHFGNIFPLSVSAKSSGFSVEQVISGMGYIYSLLRSPSGLEIGITPIGLFGATAVFCSIPHLCRNLIYSQKKGQFLSFAISICFSLSYLSFIVLSGGDWMEAGRFIVPMIPIASAFIVSAVYSFLTEWSKYIALFSISILALSTNVNIVEYQSTGVSIIHRENYTKKLSNKLSNNGTRIDSYSWFEKYNKVHARDLISIQRISHIINNYEKNDELHILSGQMGIVMYHISKKFREKISIIDNHNLTTNKISRCDPEGLKVGRSGSHVSIEKIITNMDYYENRCNLEDPDIIYDLESEYSNDLKKSGYKVVFDQTGYMSPLRKYFQGDRVKSDQFIMLDKSVKGLSDNIRFNKVGYLY